MAKLWDRQQDEGATPFAYFRWYRDHSGGGTPRRSVVATATHFGKSARTLYKYSRRHDWQDRASAWDDRIAEAKNAAAIRAAAEVAE